MSTNKKTPFQYKITDKLKIHMKSQYIAIRACLYEMLKMLRGRGSQVN
jgi:hypothetical protein